jgi:hypothetical protein
VGGPIVVRSGLDFDTASIPAEAGNLKVWRQMIVTDPSQVAAVGRILANPAGFYVNIHSTSHRPGLFRGQLELSDTARFDGLSQQISALSQLVRSLAFRLGIVLP